MGNPKEMNLPNALMGRTGLIYGVSGQDGIYLADLLLKKSYTVSGTSRDVQNSFFTNLQKLAIKDWINYISMVAEDFRSVLVALRKSESDEIYYLAGWSLVGPSFEQAHLNWGDHVIQDSDLFRPIDLAIGKADLGKARQEPRWKAST